VARCHALAETSGARNTRTENLAEAMDGSDFV
jgi:hypothetical protein